MYRVKLRESLFSLQMPHFIRFRCRAGKNCKAANNYALQKTSLLELLEQGNEMRPVSPSYRGQRNHFLNPKGSSPAGLGLTGQGRLTWTDQ